MTDRFRIDRAAAYLLAAVLVTAVLGKLLAPAGFRAFVLAFDWIPLGLRPLVFVAIPTVELVIALLLMLRPGVIGLGACAMMLGVFTSVVAIIAVVNPKILRCNCFGGDVTVSEVRESPVLILARNASLLAVAVVGLVYARRARLSSCLTKSGNRAEAVLAIRVHSRQAFTLIELLVVLGIVAVLVSLLIPAAAHVRARAQSAACLSNLREIGQLAHAWAASHGGFVPLAGDVIVDGPDGGPENLPAALHDSRRVRYAYSGDRNMLLNGREWTVPFDVALVAWSSRSDPTAWQESLIQWDREVISAVSVARVFQCPAEHRAGLLHPAARFRVAYSGILHSGSYGQFMPWWTTHDYALNGGVLSFNAFAETGARQMRGRLGAARDPASMVLAGDTPSLGRIWQPAARADRPATLADVLDRDASQVEGVGYVPIYYASFQTGRGVHRSRINLLFVDGHADSVIVSPDALRRCRLTN